MTKPILRQYFSYSQGAAMAAATLEQVDQSVKDKVVGTALFGYTKNKQNKKIIPGYPPENTKVFCAKGDLVCDGTLVITISHLTYATTAGPAAEFLAGRIKAAQQGGSGGSSSEAEDSASASEEEASSSGAEDSASASEEEASSSGAEDSASASEEEESISGAEDSASASEEETSSSGAEDSASDSEE
jgi:Cutinase